jgi:hypothetical protein
MYDPYALKAPNVADQAVIDQARRAVQALEKITRSRGALVSWKNTVPLHVRTLSLLKAIEELEQEIGDRLAAQAAARQQQQ